MVALQAADTVKQQATQLASSKSQAKIALAAQKASEQVLPHWVMLVLHPFTVHPWMTNQGFVCLCFFFWDFVLVAVSAAAHSKVCCCISALSSGKLVFGQHSQKNQHNCTVSKGCLIKRRRSLPQPLSVLSPEIPECLFVLVHIC